LVNEVYPVAEAWTAASTCSFEQAVLVARPVGAASEITEVARAEVAA
jgi:hypothetical protein